MGEVIPFKIEHSKYNSRVLRIFNNISKKVKYAKNAVADYYNDSVDELNFLDGYLSNLIVKYKDGKTWKNEKVQKKYISMINDYEFDFKEDPDNRVNIVYYELILTYLFDICPLLYKEDKYTLRDLVSAFDSDLSEHLETNSKVNREKVKVLFNPLIQELIHMDEDIYITKNMEDILKLYEEGQTIPQILSLYKDSEQEEESITLDKGIITVDRIHDYYTFQNDLLIKILKKSNKDVDEKYYKYYDSLGYLYSIDKLEDKYKLYFIALINNMRSKNKSLDEELKFVSYLSDFYRFYGEDIYKIDYDNIKNLVYYRMINDCSMDEVEEVRRSLKSVSNLKK